MRGILRCEEGLEAVLSRPLPSQGVNFFRRSPLDWIIALHRHAGACGFPILSKKRETMSRLTAALLALALGIMPLGCASPPKNDVRMRAESLFKELPPAQGEAEFEKELGTQKP
ncbi:MAG: hypothetical protein ABII00_12375 [Elusimicrobiota bacterium]